ncbi:MAG: cation transport ATPase [Rhodobacteraceae bacterium]|nr:cation transport ATPase [Paracoccaceae bacterium]
MSTWISDLTGRGQRAAADIGLGAWRARFAIAVALAGLAACAPGAGGGTTRISVADGALTFAAPRGYCVDRGAVRDGPAGVFVLFGSCAALAPGPLSPAPRPLAVLSATASANRAGAPPLAESFPRMADYFTSQAGRRALSRSGNAESVQILRAFARDGAFILHLRDQSGFAGLRAAPETWRAVLDINNRAVTLSVIGLRDAPISREDGERVLGQFIKSVRAANQP